MSYAYFFGKTLHHSRLYITLPYSPNLSPFNIWFFWKLKLAAEILWMKLNNALKLMMVIPRGHLQAVLKKEGVAGMSGYSVRATGTLQSSITCSMLGHSATPVPHQDFLEEGGYTPNRTKNKLSTGLHSYACSQGFLHWNQWAKDGVFTWRNQQPHVYDQDEPTCCWTLWFDQERNWFFQVYLSKTCHTWNEYFSSLQLTYVERSGQLLSCASTLWPHPT